MKEYLSLKEAGKHLESISGSMISEFDILERAESNEIILSVDFQIPIIAKVGVILKVPDLSGLFQNQKSQMNDYETIDIGIGYGVRLGKKEKIIKGLWDLSKFGAGRQIIRNKMMQLTGLDGEDLPDGEGEDKIVLTKSYGATYNGQINDIDTMAAIVQWRQGGEFDFPHEIDFMTRMFFTG